MCVWRYSNEIVTICYVVTNSEGIIRSAVDLIVARPLLIEKRCFVSSFTYCLLINSLYSPWKFQSTFLLRPLPCKRHIPTLLSIVADFATFVAPAFCSLFQPFSFSLFFPSSSLLFCSSLRLCSLSSSSTFCFLASRLLSRLFPLSSYLFSSSSLISLSSCPLFSVLSGQKTVLLWHCNIICCHYLKKDRHRGGWPTRQDDFLLIC